MSNASEAGDADDICVVCFRKITIFSIGECDHPVCYECSTRMRFLCDKNECPICRRNMSDVYFTTVKKPYTELVQAPRAMINGSLGIHFMTKANEYAYDKLLEDRCAICNSVFYSFKELTDHMRREHETFFCDLCLKHLMIFTSERKCYGRSELAMHRRRGDLDDTSHRGHPLCEFCDRRYMDNDHLYRHLRRDHLYCHLCDADGKHFFYRTYDELRDHFDMDHYLCEQGTCRNEVLTSVYRTEIDYKAHVAAAHSKQLGRAAAKQARTLELEFNFNPRPGLENFSLPTLTIDNEALRTPHGDLLTDADFPSLGGNEAAASHASVTFTSMMSRPKFKNEEFPSLGTGPSTATGAVRRNPRNITITKTCHDQRNHHRRGGYGRGFTLDNQDFPTLQSDQYSSVGNNTVKLTVQPPRPQTAQPSNVSIRVNHEAPGSSASIQVRPRSMAEAFPALGAPNAPRQCLQWVSPRLKKPDHRLSKVAKAPVLPAPSGFPILGRKFDKQTTSVTVPIQDTNYNKGRVENNNNPSGNGRKNQGQKKNGNSKEDARNNGNTNNNSKSKTKNSDNNPISGNSAKNNRKTKPDHKEKLAEGTNGENSNPKKTSTLKIGALGQPDAQISSPPGISVKPPPGFAGNDLTFTSSSGESYTILPNVDGAALAFQPPMNVHMRNVALIENFTKLLKNNANMDEFKSYSNLFRSGSLSAEKYYDHCRTVLGTSFSTLFPELLVLLPDIERQQALYCVHKKHVRAENLAECTSCKQVVFASELGGHMNSHYIETHFPGLWSDSSRK